MDFAGQTNAFKSLQLEKDFPQHGNLILLIAYYWSIKHK